jgi:hypothetical protein
VAANDTVLLGMQLSYPDANAATPDSMVGGSTPGEVVPVEDFDAGADEYIDLLGHLASTYDGGGITLKIPWSASSATSGNIVLDAAFRRLQDDAEDIDTSHSYSFNSVTDAAPSAAGEIVTASITFTDGADMDSLAAGEKFILRIRRNGDDASDTMSGDAELHVYGIEGIETS